MLKGSKIGILLIILVIIWSTTFLFVVQPIGAIPEGTTVWMFKPDRLFVEQPIPFICSADGMLLDTVGYVNLIGRIMMMSRIMNSSDKIYNFPYSETLFLISTDVVELDR